MYLPQGARWSNSWTLEQHDGGIWLDVNAPIDHIPLFVRDEAQVPVRDDREGDRAGVSELLGLEL